jgi:predicted amidohydrolase YtcJ
MNGWYSRSMSPTAFHHVISIALSFILGHLFWVGPSCFAAAPDLIYHNGSVVTMDGNETITEAIAIGGNNILATGNNQTILKLADSSTEIIDLRGRSVLPGLIDSHTHPLGAAMIEFDHAIPNLHQISDVLAYIASRTQTVPEGDWIVIQQVFITRLKERRYPTRQEMDRVAPNHPVIFRTGPDASLNTLAIERAGIRKDMDVPEGSKVETNPETGEPSGILRGWSRLLSIPSTGKSPTDKDRQTRLIELMRDYNANGITGIVDRNASDSAVKIYKRIQESNQLSVRVALSRSVSNQLDPEGLVDRIQNIANEPLHTNRDPFLRTIGVKMFLDGGMLTGSAFLLEPWGTSDIYGIDDPHYHGIRFISDESLRAAIKAAVQGGLQFTAHSVGDGAVHALIEAYAFVNQTNPIQSTRPNITHCNFMSPEAIDHMAALGISADIQPVWLYLDSRTLSKQFPYHRMEYFQPLRPMFEAGVLTGGGSDHMQKIGGLRSINPYNPFLGIWVAITRKALDYEGRMHAEHGLTRMQAIRFYTMNNAQLMFLENETGSLEPGKLADLIELDRNILTCPENDIRDIQVLRTFVNGKMVFDSTNR